MKAFQFKDQSIESFDPRDLSHTIHTKGDSGENNVKNQTLHEKTDVFMKAFQDARDRKQAEEDIEMLADAQKTELRKAKEKEAKIAAEAAKKAQDEQAAKDALADQSKKALKK